MKAAAYIRVSTDKEEQQSSLENQREFFESYIPRRGDEIVNIYCDSGRSATNMRNRKDLQRMRRDAKQGKFEKLYVKDISRLFRNTLDFITVTRELNSYGVRLHLVNLGEGKDIDSFTLNLMAMLAENESQRISEKVKFGKQFSKEKGIVPNFVFGYDRIDKYTLELNPEESEWVKKIFDLYTEEKWGMARIASYLYENSVPTKRLKNGEPNYEWSQVAVGRILKNELYTGSVINGKESTLDIFSNKRRKNPEDEWYVVERPEFRIISDKQFKEAQKQIKINAKAFAANNLRRSDKHLFSNLIKCGCCGFSYRRYQRRHSKNGPLYVWWVCSKRSSYGKNRCEAEYTRVNEDWLMDGLDKLFNYLLKDKEDFFNAVEQKCNSLIREYIRESSGFDLDEIKEELTELNNQRERLKRLAVEGLITMDEVKKDMLPINSEIERLSFKLNSTEKTRELNRKVKDGLKQLMDAFENFKFTDKIDNIDLKKIIKEIRIISKEEIYVYFNIDEDIEGASFPILLSGTFLLPPEGKTDTNTKYGT
ncbi:MAG: recombinase family protein, partial [Tissierellia bacterium]|nr:recombinase family protein [Tissierellia bacterium]